MKRENMFSTQEDGEKEDIFSQLIRQHPKVIEKGMDSLDSLNAGMIDELKGVEFKDDCPRWNQLMLASFGYVEGERN